MWRCSVPIVRADEVKDPLTELSADHIDEIRGGVRNAAAVSHTELARVCAGYCDHFNISYQTIRKLADVPLPNYPQMCRCRTTSTLVQRTELGTMCGRPFRR